MEGIGVLGDDNSTACKCKAVSHACVRRAAASNAQSLLSATPTYACSSLQNSGQSTLVPLRTGCGGPGLSSCAFQPAISATTRSWFVCLGLHK